MKKRKIVDADQSKAISLDRQLVASTFEQNCVDPMMVIQVILVFKQLLKTKGERAKSWG